MGMTIAEYAKHRGVTPGAVRYALKRGRIERGEDGTIDPGDADLAWSANTSEAHARPNGRRGNPQTGTMVESTKRKTDAYTAYLELKALKLAGTLIDKAAALDAVAALATQFRDRFMSFCQRIAPLAAADCGGDAGKLRRFLDRECREELTRMSDGSIKLGGEE